MIKTFTDEKTGEKVDFQLVDGQWQRIEAQPPGFTHPALPEREKNGTKAQLDQLLQNLSDIPKNAPDDPISNLTNGFITMGPGNPGIESILQGATFYSSDELQGFLGADKEAIREGQKNLPTGQKLVGNLLGGLIGGKALFDIGKSIPFSGSSLSNTLTTSALSKPKTTAALTGAVSGGLAGAGNAPDLSSVPSEMLKGSVLGGLLSPATVGAGQLAGRLISRPAQALNRTVSELSPRNLAINQTIRALERDAIDPGDLVNNLNRLGPEARLVDVGGPNTRALAQSTINTPGRSRQLAETALRGRSNRSVQRLISDSRRFLGTDRNLFRATRDLVQSRAESARPLYQELRGQRPLLTDDFAEFMQRPDLRSAFSQGIRKARNDGVRLPSELEAGNVIPFEVVDYTKRALDDKIGVAIRGGKRDTARQLLNLKNGLVEFADASFPGYQQARQAFTDDSAMLNAAELGRQILRTDADEMTDLVSRMPDSERRMFVVGALKSITDKIKSTTEGGDSGRRFATQLIRERIRPAFPDDDSFNAFLQGVERERIFQQSKGILGGSPTAQRLSDQSNIAEDIALDAATGNFLNTALNGVRNFMRSQPQIPEQVRDELGEIMFSSIANGRVLPNRVIQRLARNRVSRDQIDRIMSRLRLGVGFEAGIVGGGNE